MKQQRVEAIKFHRAVGRFAEQLCLALSITMKLAKTIENNRFSALHKSHNFKMFAVWPIDNWGILVSILYGFVQVPKMEREREWEVTYSHSINCVCMCIEFSSKYHNEHIVMFGQLYCVRRFINSFASIFHVVHVACYAVLRALWQIWNWRNVLTSTNQRMNGEK